MGVLGEHAVGEQAFAECPGAGALFPWTDLVYKNSPNKQVAWEFMRFISNAKDDMEHHQLQGILPVWTANLDSDYVKEMAAQIKADTEKYAKLARQAKVKID